MAQSVHAADNVTAELANWVCDDLSDRPTPAAFERAKLAVIDWYANAIAGAGQAVTQALIEQHRRDGVAGRGSVIGAEHRLPPAAAAWVNGTASHALDYDDINKRMHGHPSVAIFPAALALAERDQCSGAALLDAFICGVEVACTLGETLGESHYQRGFHSTATVGTIGAAAACARLLKLDRAQTCAALNFAAAQAAGLRATFGSMAKPLQVGKAAMNGYLAATLAAQNIAAGSNVVGGLHGLISTQSDSASRRAIRSDTDQPFGIETNIFKFHAACYYTHSAIDALLALKTKENFSASDVASITVGMRAGHLNVCCIGEPRDGLEIKFSQQHLLATTLLEHDTASVASYTEQCASDPELVELRQRIRVRPEPLESRTACRLNILLRNGMSLDVQHDSGVPEVDDEALREKLSKKFRALAEIPLGTESTCEVIARLLELDVIDSISSLMNDLGQQSNSFHTRTTKT